MGSRGRKNPSICFPVAPVHCGFLQGLSTANVDFPLFCHLFNRFVFGQWVLGVILTCILS